MISMTMSYNDRNDFEKLYLENRQLAFNVANKILGNETLSEDAVSDSFLRIAEIFSKVKGLNSHKMQYYIVVTVRNTCFNMLKQSAYKNKELSIDEAVITNKYDSVDADYISLKDCISRLSETDKEILYLRVNLGMDFSLISKTLGISSAAARQRYRYAKRNLKKLLAKGEE